MNRFLKILFCFLLFFLSLSAQQRAMTVEELKSWRRIAGQSISNDGKWVAAKIAPWEGDAVLFLYNDKGEAVAEFSPVGAYAFSASSEYLVLSLISSKSLTDSLKLAKVKKDKMPMENLLLKPLRGEEERIDSVRNYRLAQEDDWLAYQSGRSDSTLYVRSLDGSRSFRFPAVSEYQFAPKSGMIYFLSAGDTLGTQAGLYTLNPGTGTLSLAKPGKEHYRQVTWDERGERLGFLHCEKKDSAYKSMSLWLWEAGPEARLIAERGNAAFPPQWVISEHDSLAFSRNGQRLFFGTSPEPRQPDTTRLTEDWPGVEVWSWNEPIQYTVQHYNKAMELKRAYRAVHDLATGKLIQLGNRDLPNTTLASRGDGDYALLSTTEPYSLSSMWEGRTRRDVWSVSLLNGERRLLKEADYNMPRLSPGGNYAYWYAEPDSAWYAADLVSGTEVRLASPDTFPAWDEENDMPDYPASHGIAGWAAEDEYIFIYDRYDIWRFDPTGRIAPLNLTKNGRGNHIKYRRVRLDPEERSIDLSEPQFLAGFDEKTKGYGYYRIKFTGNNIPEVLLAGDYMLGMPLKARNADKVIFTQETYTKYPELYYADLSLRSITPLTKEGRQQDSIRWGTAELISWVSLDGKPLDGVIYKPDGFDPAKKYPLLVNFYDRNAETLHSYHLPSPHRSTIDYHLYNSNGYVIFNPDIVYKDGYPGESCYNCVMPGIAALIGEGFIDEKAIGAQGHSWGGYQVAYLATRTDLFAAIESGAPVVNMFSAYGGIRWGSGMARAFQYEHGQSRIGNDPWNGFREYVENSPLFAMDKVTTPILIMHNDNDGHVPWYQGIEYFVALKRLGKPAWLLNYAGEIHWPGKMPNRVDFQKRMFQFFNHYLKKEQMPVWMSEGVKAVNQDFELGYELPE